MLRFIFNFLFLDYLISSNLTNIYFKSFRNVYMTDMNFLSVGFYRFNLVITLISSI